MGGEQAADVLATVKKDQTVRGGATLTDDEVNAIRQPILDRYEHEASPYYATARLWDDGVLTPTKTRDTLAVALRVATRVPLTDPSYGVFRM